MRQFRFTAAEIESLAGGYGSPGALATLRSGQRAARRLQLLAIWQRSHRLPEPAHARLDTAFALIEDIARVAPEVAAALLDHPFLGTWAAACLARLESNTTKHAIPVDVELGYLSGLAAAGAVRAGIRFELEVSIWDGSVLLPTLGTLHIGRSGTAFLRGDATELTCSIDDRTVTVTPPFDVEQDAWRPRRSVSLADGWTLAVEDTDPYGDCFGHPRSGPLDDTRRTALEESLEQAWRLLTEQHPEHAAGVRTLLDAIVPLAAPANGTISAASRVAAGAIGVSIPDDPVELALLLVHEVQHMKLGELLDLVDLHATTGPARHHAPWRGDPRPVGALFQGVYAHLGVADFWRLHRRHTTGPAARRAEYEFAYWYEQTRRAAATLAASGELTEDGARFVTGVIETMDGWRHEAISPSVSSGVADLLLAATVDWRMRNHVPDADDVTGLAASWLAGRPADVVGPPALGRGSAPGTAKQPAVAALVTSLVSDVAAPTLVTARERSIVADRPSDPQGWINLAIALRRDGHPASSVVEARPDLTSAVCVRLRAMGDRADPVDVATWLCEAVTRAATSAAVRCRS